MKKLLSIISILFLLCACGSKEETVDISGYYSDNISGRAQLEVVNGGEGGNIYTFNIHWGSSAFESTEWSMFGALEDNKVEYSSAFENEIVYTSETEYTTTNVYENGTGTFTYNEEEKSLTWHSDMENDSAYEEDIVFVLNQE